MFVSDVNLKKTNSFFKGKNCIQNLNLNNVLFESNFPLETSLPMSNSLEIKNSLYSFLKLLKQYKVLNYSAGSCKESNNFSFWLQHSWVYSSALELEKSKKLRNLYSKLYLLSTLGSELNCSPFFKQASFPVVPYSTKEGYNAFSNKVLFLKSLKSKRMISFFKTRKFFESLFSKQFAFNLVSYKKKYQVVNGALKNASTKIKSLSTLYVSRFVKYIYTKAKIVKIYKKLVWKRKKKHKWKQSVLFRYYRSRHRLFYKFYIPRHLEINYKTFSFISMATPDISSLSSKITFWLNTRRLLTFLSS